MTSPMVEWWQSRLPNAKEPSSEQKHAMYVCSSLMLTSNPKWPHSLYRGYRLRETQQLTQSQPTRDTDVSNMICFPRLGFCLCFPQVWKVYHVELEPEASHQAKVHGPQTRQREAQGSVWQAGGTACWKIILRKRAPPLHPQSRAAWWSCPPSTGTACLAQSTCPWTFKETEDALYTSMYNIQEYLYHHTWDVLTCIHSSAPGPRKPTLPWEISPHSTPALGRWPRPTHSQLWEKKCAFPTLGNSDWLSLGHVPHRKPGDPLVGSSLGWVSEGEESSVVSDSLRPHGPPGSSVHGIF